MLVDFVISAELPAIASDITIEPFVHPNNPEKDTYDSSGNYWVILTVQNSGGRSIARQFISVCDPVIAPNTESGCYLPEAETMPIPPALERGVKAGCRFWTRR